MADEAQAGREAREGELFRLLVENVKDYAIFVIDPEGRVESWNPGAERLLGYDEGEMIGRSIEVFFTPEDIEKGFPQREMEQALTDGATTTAGTSARTAPASGAAGRSRPCGTTPASSGASPRSCGT